MQKLAMQIDELKRAVLIHHCGIADFCISLERLASGEACVHIMPPLDFITFAELPAE